jgi:aspartyl-tRNA(Asn)/glutamyl-tRNA(Gln) amidotransferase subunit A
MGSLTRSVPDSALMLNVVARDDDRDFYRGSGFPQDWGLDLEKPIQGLKIAYSADLGYADVASDIARACEQAAFLLEKLGGIVERADPGFGDPVESFNILWHAGAANIVDRIPISKRKKMDPGLLSIARAGKKIPILAYMQAMETRTALAEKMTLFHKKYPVLITPALPITAFQAGRNQPEGDPNGDWVGWTPFTYPFNMTQQPASSIPCGFGADGLPVGLSVIAAKYQDLLVMRVSRALERELMPVFPSAPRRR